MRENKIIKFVSLVSYILVLFIVAMTTTHISLGYVVATILFGVVGIIVKSATDNKALRSIVGASNIITKLCLFGVIMYLKACGIVLITTLVMAVLATLINIE